MMAAPDPDTPKLRSQLPGYNFIVAGFVESAPGVAYLEFARPERHNSFHEELWIEFPRALRELDAKDDTRVIVVTGQGKNFCAGIDVGYLQRTFLSLAPPPAQGPSSTAAATAAAASCPGEQRAAMRRGILALQEALTELERCRAPVLAAVHGRCIGGGVDLITACDLRICSPCATFCVKEVDLAIAADLGTLQRLPHIVGHGVAMDLALTARTVGAAEAQRIGLVSSVVGPVGPEARVGAAAGGPAGPRAAMVTAALRLAAAIADKPRLAVQGTKRVLLHARDNPRVSDGLDYVATWNSAQLISADMAAVMDRFGSTGGGAPAARPGAAGAGAGAAAAGPRARL